MPLKLKNSVLDSFANLDRVASKLSFAGNQITKGFQKESYPLMIERTIPEDQAPVS